jgi:sugar phosphate isomerase/epimerase
MKQGSQDSGRRRFLRVTAMAGAGVACGGRVIGAEVAGQGRPLFSAMGIAGPLDRAAVFREHGARFLTAGTGDFLVPDQGDDVFAKQLEILAASPLPVLACNGFIRPPHLRCVGADANHDAVLQWADVAFRRLKQAGGRIIVFGSAGSRALRDGWSRKEADQQFVALLKRMGPLAEKQGIIVAVEQLQASECNYINRIGEAAGLIRQAGHPNIRVLADFFHMASMGDGPAELREAMDVVTHVEIAEKGGRTFPGVAGDDFRPLFRVLRAAGYQGAVSIEGKGTDDQLGPAFREIARQAGDV